MNMLSRLWGKLGRLHYDELRRELLRRNNKSRAFVLSTFGVTMLFDLACETDIAILSTIFRHGIYEENVSRYVAKTLKLGNRFIDAGASCGYYTLLGHLLVGSAGRVIAVEPSRSYSRLLDNLQYNLIDDVQVVNTALWRRECQLKFYYYEQDGFDSVRQTSGFLHRTLVPATTLDSLIERQHIDLVKLDCQGAEKEILEGAEASLNAKLIRRIVLEWYTPLIPNPDEAFKLYSSTGKLYRLKTDQMTPVTKRSQLPDSCDLVLIPE